MPQVVVWRKGIDTARFHPKFRSEEMRAKLTGGHSEAPLLLYVGRLAREKRIQDLKPLLARFPGARLALVGTGPHEGELKELFQGSNCVFTGQLSGQELSAAFASAGVIVIPSDSGTLGFVVLEAMACILMATSISSQFFVFFFFKLNKSERLVRYA